MNKFLKNFRGIPRPKQVEFTDWLDETWSTGIVGGKAGTGVGKSRIGMSVMDTMGGVYVASSNMLMDQLISNFPGTSYLKGSAHYTCNGWEEKITCRDMGDIGKRCDNCPYELSKNRILAREVTFVNPMSYLYLKHTIEYNPSHVMVVDEAHTLLGYLQMISGTSLPISKYGEPKSLEVFEVLTWLRDKVANLKVTRKESPSVEEKAKAHRMIEKLITVEKGLVEDSNKYIIYVEEDKVNVKPILPPKFIVDRFLDSNKTIMMSASLNKFIMRELLQHDNFKFKDFGSPIPVDNRRILIQPSQFKVNKDTPPNLLAAWVKAKLRKYPNRNTIVHMSYRDIERVKDFIPGVIYNNPDDKTDKIKEFKAKGGVFLAGGCSEGVDLPGDECRLNLIPKLIKPNLGDPITSKRKALSDGDRWYNMTIMDNLEQQAGRSTRGVDDSSTTIVGDPNISWIYNNVEGDLNDSFKQALVWGKR